MDPRHTKLPLQYNQPNLYSGGRCPSPEEVTYPYPLYKDPTMEKLKLAHFKQNQVGTVIIHSVRIVSLMMEGKERLCLAQISNTLLKDYSYNEIHNRRVALGITCVQCTPVQLEILRRAGAMPISSRRCGMITRREAERLCKSFLGDNSPPRLPDNFAFEILHDCAWGCRGQFVPGRYNSSRAKCIKCSFCAIFFSPNKFVFHSHRLTEAGKYIQPDAANFNSWRRHIRLVGDPHDEIVHAWEDVKAMFNGGTRKRMMSHSPLERSQSPPPLSSPVGTFSSLPSLPTPPPCKSVKIEPPAEKASSGERLDSPASPLYSELSLGGGKELQDYLWPRPPHYSLLWPGRPLPSLPHTKDPLPHTPDLSEMFARSQQEPFFGFFFSNNNFSIPSSKEGKSKRENGISRFMDGPFFRESAFQPFKKETTSQDEEKTEEDDSEVDEMVDIEKIEDKEEDNGNSSASVVTSAN